MEELQACGENQQHAYIRAGFLACRLHRTEQCEDAEEDCRSPQPALLTPKICRTCHHRWGSGRVARVNDRSESFRSKPFVNIPEI